MSGFTSFPISNLLAAQAAAFNKGQDVSQDNSKERLEKNRLRRQNILNTQQAETTQKANDPERGGFLA